MVGNGFFTTNSPFDFIEIFFPLESNISTSIPRLSPCISPALTFENIFPKTKHPTISVPPLIEAS